MTKQTFGIISDLHMEFDGWSWDFYPEADVFYLCAGDIDSSTKARQAFIDKHSDHMLAIKGNHDFYGGSFDPVQTPIEREVNGFKIAAATLWTDLSNPIDWIRYVRGLVDASRIHGLSAQADIYNRIHQEHKKFLLNSDADVIVSHHAPSWQSISKEFTFSSLNACFVSDLDEEILNMKHPPQLWVCGHVHHKHDYWIGETHVVSNPRGYPGESNYNNYQPELITLEK